MKNKAMGTELLSKIINSFYADRPDAGEYDISPVNPSLKIFPKYSEEKKTVLYSAGLLSGNGFRDRAGALWTENKPTIDEALAELTRMLYNLKTPFCVGGIANKDNDLRTVSFVFSKEKGRWVFFPSEMTLSDVESIIRARERVVD